MDAAGSTEPEPEADEDPSIETLSTKRRRTTSAVEESLKKGVLAPPPIKLGERLGRAWETSGRLLSEKEVSMTAKVEEWWRVAVVRSLFLEPPRIIWNGDSGFREEIDQRETNQRWVVREG